MDSDQFDTATLRLDRIVSRRRTLGALAALGGTAAFLADDIDARKKGKHRKRHKTKPTTTPPPPDPCAACTSCQTCVNGACTPKAEDAPCGTGAICVRGACAQTCVLQSDCPTGRICTAHGVKSSICTTGDVCFIPTTCSGDSECAAGEICSYCVIKLRSYCTPIN